MILNLTFSIISFGALVIFGIRFLNDLGLRSSPKFNFLFWEWSKQDNTAKEQNEALDIELMGVNLRGETVIALMLKLDEKKVDKISDLTLVYEMPTNPNMGTDEPSGGLRMTLFDQKGFIYTNQAYLFTLYTDKDIEIRMNDNLNSVMQGPFVDKEKFEKLYVERIINEGMLIATWRDAYNNRQVKKWKYSTYLNLIKSYKKNGGFRYGSNSFSQEMILPQLKPD